MDLDIDISQASTIKYKSSFNWHKLVFGLILIIAVFLIVLFFIFALKLKSPSYVSPISIKSSTDKQSIVSSIIAKKTDFPKKEIIGFLPSWTVAKKTKVNPKRLSQLIYFGLSVNSNGELVKYNADNNEVLEWTYLNSDYLSDLRKEASVSGTKILIAIKNLENEEIDRLISNESATKTFIKGVTKLIQDYHIDGINLDFEYFSDTNFPTAKYLNKFLDAVTKELKKEKQDFIISFDVNALNVVMDRAYDMVKIGELVDQIILMAYDFHRVDSIRSGPVAPILADENEHSITESLNSLPGRVAKEKIILGIPFYGYEWQTISDKPKSPTVSTTGALATYQRVRELIENRDDVQIFWDEKAMSPWLTYAQSGATKQIYYEDEKSIAKKLELVADQKMAGIAIWALGYEGEYEDLWQVIENNK